MSAKRSIRWSDATMARFLELYQHHECLWNNNSEIYKNKDARDAALQKIILELNLNMAEVDLKNKIKSIRTMYRKELMLIIKSKKSGAGADDIYRPRLIWFDQADSFLRGVTLTRESSSSSDIDNETARDVESPTSEFVRPSTPQPQVLQAPHRKRKLDSINDALNKLEQISSASSREPDEFDHFGKFVAALLRKMPEYDALLCQEEIHSTLRRYRLRLISGSSNSEASISPSGHCEVSMSPSGHCEVSMSPSSHCVATTLSEDES